MHKIVPECIQACFERVLGQIFRKFFCPVFRGGSSFRKFSKKNVFKIPKMPKSVPKSLQTRFEHVLGQTFRKIFAQFSMECRVFDNFQKKNLFKIPKLPKSVPKSIQTCFRVIFLKKIYAQCSMEGQVFDNFQKKMFSKFQKCPKMFKKVSKPVLNMFWGKLFEKFLRSFPWSVESSTIFKKNIFKIPKLPKSVPKSIQTCFRVIFSKKIYAQCSMEGRVFENFPKFFFQNSKNAQNRSQKNPNVF